MRQDWSSCLSNLRSSGARGGFHPFGLTRSMSCRPTHVLKLSQSVARVKPPLRWQTFKRVHHQEIAPSRREPLSRSEQCPQIGMAATHLKSCVLPEEPHVYQLQASSFFQPLARGAAGSALAEPVPLQQLRLKSQHTLSMVPLRLIIVPTHVQLVWTNLAPPRFWTNFAGSS